MPSTYTRAYWRALSRDWEDAASVLALDTLSRADELRRMGGELGWPAERTEAAVHLLARAANTLDGSLSTRLFADFFARVDRVAPELEIPCASVPLLGTLPSGRINALAISVPASSEHILAFDTGLWLFADAVANCVSSAFARDGGQGLSILPRPLESEENRGWLDVAARIAARYLFTGTPFLPDYPIPGRGPHRTLKSAIGDAFLLFVVGHEYAHVALGHLDDVPGRRLSLADRVSCTVRAPEDHARELDADRAGTLLAMTASLRPHGYPFWFTGPLPGFFLRAAGLLYDHLQALGGPGLADGTHPPTGVRRQAMDEAARGALPDEMASSYDYWASILDQLATRLEEAIDGRVQPLLRDGWTLAPVWTRRSAG